MKFWLLNHSLCHLPSVACIHSNVTWPYVGWPCLGRGEGFLTEWMYFIASHICILRPDQRPQSFFGISTHPSFLYNVQQLKDRTFLLWAIATTKSWWARQAPQKEKTIDPKEKRNGKLRFGSASGSDWKSREELDRHWRYSHGVIYQVFSLCFCKLQAIKTRVGWRQSRNNTTCLHACSWPHSHERNTKTWNME